MVTAIDENGKVRLSRQAVLEGWTPEEALAHDRPGHSSNSGERRSSGRSGGHSSGRNSDRRGSYNNSRGHDHNSGYNRH